MKGGLLMKKRNVFLLGAALGAAAVALLTPKSGKEMQKEFVFNVKIAYNSTRTETFLASFTSCSATMVRRNVKEKAADTAQVFWDLSISLEEV